MEERMEERCMVRVGCRELGVAMSEKKWVEAKGSGWRWWRWAEVGRSWMR